MPARAYKSSSKRRNPDVIDQAAATGMEIANAIFSIPSAVLDQSIKTTLEGKDALKHALNPNQDELRYELLGLAATSRNVIELARIHKWAVSRGDSELKNVVEARAKDLGLYSRLKENYPRQWNPKRSDRLVRNPEVTDRALRYRANQNAPDGPEICAFCGSKTSIDVGHIDGHEENNDPDNLIWICRSCNVASANTMRNAGMGRLTRQYNPHGATTVGEWMQAVGAITPHKGRKYAGKSYGLTSDMPVSEAVAMIRATSPAKRREFASQLSKHRGRRSRSNPESGAARFYKKFHGRDSEEELIVETEIHEHEWLGVLGLLCSVVITLPSGDVATIDFDERDAPWLCSSENGEQLYIEGGCQKVDLKQLGFSGPEASKEFIVLGEFSPREPGRRWNLAYLCEKDFDNFETIRYEHDLSEPDEGEPKSARRIPAYLEYDRINELLMITGGAYHIELPVLETSPGIEN